MLEDKNIHDIFAHADLDNEDWLQPSDKVFDGIEAAIYTKKRFRGFWFLLPLIFMLSGAGIYYWSHLNEKSIVENQIVSKDNSQLNSDLVSSKATTKTRSKEKDDFDISYKNIEMSSNKKNAKPLNKEKVHKRIVQADKNSIKKNPTKNLWQNIKTNQTASKKGLAENSSSKNSTSIVASKSNLYANNLVNKNIRLAQSDEPILSTPTVHKHLKPLIPLVDESKTVPIKSGNHNTQALNRLALQKHNLANESERAFIKNSRFNILPKPRKQFQYEFSSGFSAFNLRLNQTFSKFLKPKGFEHKMGKGFFVSAGIQKKWNSSISIHANLQYEQAVFQLSHNAIKLYDIEEEITDQTNTINVEIASPLGFANSGLAIKRTTEDVVDQTTELSISLNNCHQIFAVDAGFGLSAQLINFVKLHAETVFYTGIHQLLFVKHDLNSFETKHTNFEPLENSPLSSQSQLQQTRPYFGLGLQFYYQIKTTQGIRFKYVFKQDVLPLYKENTYRSLLNRQQVGLSYVVQF